MRDGARGGRRTLGWTLGWILALACALAGCAIPFGSADEPGTAPTPAYLNRLYLEEQERLERQRQSFEGVRPSER